MTAVDVAREVLAEIDEGRPDATRITQLARAVIAHEAKLHHAMCQRDRAESQAYSLRLHNDGLTERIDRLEPIAQAAGVVLARWGAQPSADSDLAVAISALRQAVMT